MASNNFRLREVRFWPLLPFILLLALPFLAHLYEQPFFITFVARVVIYAIAATALNLALGYGGMVSFGHALFFGLGAYSVAIPAFYGIDNGWIHLLVCLLSCGLIGLATGAVSLRTTGIAFIMITLAFAQMGYFIFVSLKQYGGDDGTPVTATSHFFGLDLGQPDVLYGTALLVLAVATWWMARLRVAPFGMVLRGARQNPRRINAVGLPVRRYLLSAYVLSAMLCGVAGMLLANLNAFASPGTLSWMLSGELIVMVVLGGIGTVYGALLGACAYLGVEEAMKMLTEHWMAIFGLSIVAVALLGKTGLVGMLDSLRNRWRRRAHDRGRAAAWVVQNQAEDRP